MYFHVLVETSEKVGKNKENRKLYELDKTDISEIENDVIMPYVQGKQFQFDGYFINPTEVKRITVKQTNKTTGELSKYENDTMPAGVFLFVSRTDILDDDEHTEDLTKDIFARVESRITTSPHTNPSGIENRSIGIENTKVFIVHGHDDLAKTEIARFIEKMEFEAIILHEKASVGKTIIEKIEQYSNVGFGVILYTPCDVGAEASKEPNLKPRARQNVVFEHGFLIGKLGRANVCALVKDSVDTPNDILGVVYIKMDISGAWKMGLAKEMRESGYDIDMNRVI